MNILHVCKVYTVSDNSFNKNITPYDGLASKIMDIQSDTDLIWSTKKNVNHWYNLHVMLKNIKKC